MRRHARWFPVLMLMGTAYVGTRSTGTHPSPMPGPHPGRPECPHDWDFKKGQMALVGPTINVPEFHDCQRFIVYSDTGAVYDSLYAIFAARGLDTLDTTLSLLDTAGSGKVALAAAEVYAEGVYPPLGIRAMFSCLYLFRVDGVWNARMVPQGRAERDCSLPVDATTLAGPTLLVRRYPSPKFADSDFPAVARWDWDSLHHWQTIGLKCGRAWCEVGPTGFETTRPPVLFVGAGTQKLRRTRMIKGWYDQQFLADTGADGTVKPSRIWGTIWPDSGLDDADTVRAFRRGSWVRVAQVALEDRSGVVGTANPYKTRMNLDLTNATGPFNTISLCRGTRAQCHPDLTTLCDGDGQWWGRVDDATNDGSPARYLCTVRRAHDALAYHVPGSARWRWLATDETTWKRCDAGCCELH